LHWVMRDKDMRPWGLLSLTDISTQHRRSEVLIGVMDGAPYGIAVAAMLCLFSFYFNIMRFNKMVALIYNDNPRALTSAIKLGFHLEGCLREHVLDQKSSEHLDIMQLGLLKNEALSSKNIERFQRLI